MTCSTLITSHCHTALACTINRVAIRTHQRTAGHLSQLHFWDHDIIKHEFSALIKAECEALDGIYRPVTESYHQTRYWNKFMESCGTDYAVLSSADVIFYHGWLDALIACYAAHPDLLSVHPVTFSLQDCGLSYQANNTSHSNVHITANPLCHVIMHRIANGWRWDENFPYWEGDMDYHLSMERSGRRAGIVTDSRVDHLEGSFLRNHDTAGVICWKDSVPARRRLEAKWNLAKPA